MPILLSIPPPAPAAPVLSSAPATAAAAAATTVPQDLQVQPYKMDVAFPFSAATVTPFLWHGLGGEHSPVGNGGNGSKSTCGPVMLARVPVRDLPPDSGGKHGTPYPRDERWVIGTGVECGAPLCVPVVGGYTLLSHVPPLSTLDPTPPQPASVAECTPAIACVWTSGVQQVDSYAIGLQLCCITRPGPPMGSNATSGHGA
jgi:hypothetical protein